MSSYTPQILNRQEINQAPLASKEATFDEKIYYDN
jgi:hypothetical protein